MPEARTKLAVGIDLGTTNSVVAHLDKDGRPWTIKNAEGDATTPSVVFFDRAANVIGKEALKIASYEPHRIAQFAKRDMGRAAYHKAISGHRLPPEVVQALVLAKLKADAELSLGAIEQVVITVPAFFNEPRRKATQDAGRLAGLDVMDIINEPTAAALAFGVQRGFLTEGGEARGTEIVLVYDLGGGTFDATLMAIEGRHYKALATVGDVHLGGIDWDRRIVDHLATLFEEEFGEDPREDPGAHQRLLQEAEDAKRGLTARDRVMVHFEHLGQRLRAELTREEFESLTGDLLERTLFTVRNLLKDASVSWDDITRLLLVGGSTRMPMIQHGLEKESGKQVDRSLSPDEAVAHGAAIYAGLLLSVDRSERPDMSVTNVNSHDLGVLGIEPTTKRRRRQVLIPRNSSLPATGKGTFVTQRDDQASVAVNVIEGGDASGNHSTPIGKCVIADLPPGLPAKTPIKVLFTYGEDGRLTVTAHVEKAQREASLTIERASGLSDDMIEQWRDEIRQGLVIEEEEEVEQVFDEETAAGVLPVAESSLEGEAFEDEDDDLVPAGEIFAEDDDEEDEQANVGEVEGVMDEGVMDDDDEFIEDGAFPTGEAYTEESEQEQSAHDMFPPSEEEEEPAESAEQNDSDLDDFLKNLP